MSQDYVLDVEIKYNNIKDNFLMCVLYIIYMCNNVFDFKLKK